MKFKYGFNKRYCPCLICLKRPICSCGHPDVLCGMLAKYLQPNNQVIPLRYIHAKKILPKLKDVKWEWEGEIGGWLNIPYALTISDYDRRRRLEKGLYVPQYVNTKK